MTSKGDRAAWPNRVLAGFVAPEQLVRAIVSELTRILEAAQRGEPSAVHELLPLVYQELRKLAAHKMAHEVPGHTLQPTALVHEAYLRLVGSSQPQQWAGRGHFFAAAAEAMRRILVDRAREKQALKRGGNLQRVDIEAAWLGRSLSRQTNFAEAEIQYCEALAVRRKALTSRHPDVARSFNELAFVLRAQGKISELEALHRDELSHLRVPDANGVIQVVPRSGVVLHELSNVLRELKKYSEAKTIAEEAAALYVQHPDWPEDDRKRASEVLAAVVKAQGNSTDSPAAKKD